jgi:hypothetical protein
MSGLPGSIQEALLPILAGLLPGGVGGSVRLRDVEELPRQASNRRYFRLHLEGYAHSSVVLMLLPENASASEEAGEGAEATELPFVFVQRQLAGAGVKVPRIFADRSREGFLLLEDLGRRHLLDARTAAPETSTKLLRQGVEALIEFQHRVWGMPDGGLCVAQGRSFQAGLLMWELEHFREWLLEAGFGLTVGRTERTLLDAAFQELVGFLTSQEVRLVHRDFQSTNLMPGERGLVIIDFQDALMGPWVYDAVALLRDSYWPLDSSELETMKRLYFDGIQDVAPCRNYGEFDVLFRMQTVQRKLKDAGRFVFIDRVKGNPKFLPYVPRTVDYVLEALSGLAGGTGLTELADLLTRARRPIP